MRARDRQKLLDAAVREGTPAYDLDPDMPPTEHWIDEPTPVKVTVKLAEKPVYKRATPEKKPEPEVQLKPKLAEPDPRDEKWEKTGAIALLDKNQLSMLEAWHACTATVIEGGMSRFPIFIDEASRQIGKSFMYCVQAVDFCQKNPKARVKYAAPTAVMVRDIIRPHLRDILADAPPKYRPWERIQDGVWAFKNDAELKVAGCDTNPARLRGPACHLGILDEGGFFAALQYVWKNILWPQFTVTRGRARCGSTPADSPSHDFTSFCEDAERIGAYLHRTIYDNPRLTPADIEYIKKECGGETSTTWRREYMAERVTDARRAVIPEATAERLKALVSA